MGISKLLSSESLNDKNHGNFYMKRGPSLSFLFKEQAAGKHVNSERKEIT